MTTPKYDENAIEILEDLEHVRLRPEMYIGDTGSYGLHHILKEVIDNAIDEFIDGHVKSIGVKIDTITQTATVMDDGRGIPVKLHKKAKVPTLTAVFTKLHSGGKFRKGAYTGAGAGLHGIGVKATTALSEKLTVWTHQDGATYTQSFTRGVPDDKIVVSDKALRCGTRVTFKPDSTIFQDVKFNPDNIRSSLIDVSRLCNGLTIAFRVDDKEPEVFRSTDGLMQILKDAANGAGETHKPIVIKSDAVEAVLLWTDRDGEHWRSFVNVSPTPEHGTHVNGAKKAIQEVLLSLADAKAGRLKGEDLRDGLVAVVHAKVVGPKFQGQTKVSLKNRETETAVAAEVETALRKFAASNQQVIKGLLDRAVALRDAKKKFRAQQEAIRGTKVKQGARGILPGKLCEAPRCDSSVRELFIVEGDSAYGIVHDARLEIKDGDGDRIHFQEVFPLRGKVLNAAKVGDLDEVLKNTELSNITQAVGTGIGPAFDIDKCRYNNIFLLMDADPDGKHITALLLSFLVKHMPKLVEAGKVKVVLNPLFRGVTAKNTAYGNTIEEVKTKLGNPKDVILTRFKGLGEADAEDMRIWAMDPKTRQVCDVLWAGDGDRQLVLDYMGLDAAARKVILEIVD